MIELSIHPSMDALIAAKLHVVLNIFCAKCPLLWHVVICCANVKSTSMILAFQWKNTEIFIPFTKVLSIIVKKYLSLYSDLCVKIATLNDEFTTNLLRFFLLGTNWSVELSPSKNQKVINVYGHFEQFINVDYFYLDTQKSCKRYRSLDS